MTMTQSAASPPRRLQRCLAALWAPCSSTTLPEQLDEMAWRCSSLKNLGDNEEWHMSVKDADGDVRRGSVVRNDGMDKNWEDSLPTGREETSDRRTRVVVVGAQENHAKDVVDVLTCGGGYEAYTTKAGRRLLAPGTESSVGHVYLETTPLAYVNAKSITAIAKRWISQNSLRRAVVGRSITVICVIPYATLEGEFFCKRTDDRFCWLDALRLIFREHKEGVMFLVTNCPQDISKRSRTEVETIVQCHQFHSKNIVYCRKGDDVRDIVDRTWTSEEVPKATRGRWKNSIFSTSPEKSTLSSSPERTMCVTPSLVKEVRSSKTKYEIWGPDRVLLFGRTGSGKSTLAQMLTVGNIDPDSSAFSVRSGVRGCTKDIERGEGRGWYVVDTPGFGELDCKGSTVSNDYVSKIVKKFISIREGTFTHYLFVFQKGPVDELDVKLWRFFKVLFGDDLSSHFSIVVSNADPTWLAENEEHLGQQFRGCSSFLCAEFPPNDFDEEGSELAEELEAENQAVRTSSLQELEEQLDRLRRCDRPCNYGKKSRMTKVIERERRSLDRSTS